ncbi:MAG: hypothetical protein H0W08_12285 [Acidobacteria bacterium]|nr:hypothetical protein [Acidobacteriota bacterium]
MTHHESDDRLDAYLWDPTAPRDEGVVAMEKRLEPARFDPGVRPLSYARAERARITILGGVWWRGLAAAAVLLLVAGTGLLSWRMTWPEGRPWQIESASEGSPELLAVGETLQTASAQTAMVRIARIGTMQVGRDSAVTLRMTQSNRHRLALDRGTVHVRVWAPPFSLAFRTPAGEVYDMGCEFDLSVDGPTSHVRVTSGWVQLENDLGESLVPAGASSTMTSTTFPGVPVFDDAADSFRDAVRALEAGRGGQPGAERIAQLARPRDMLTLLTLIELDVAGRAQLASRAVALSSPPEDVSVERILRGEKEMLWRWRETLPLPPEKGGWWMNWKDALPHRAVTPSR